jgi:carbonic anhydrase
LLVLNTVHADVVQQGRDVVRELVEGQPVPAPRLSAAAQIGLGTSWYSDPREELRHDPEALVEQAVRANIRASVNHLRHGSHVLEQLIQEEDLLVVGAEYSLESGVVDFFDGAPAAA